ncbi:heterokaryon incompatibility protein-domain-containing protein [Microdochium trichocladiopsis]|uniref:Heterokaryon incompatibility protein-domain-containing protein n=1 Tax=Microdochium trichocladiopsis TaxID=1682393 RepID=A0A9P8XW52_9PEZI|nr:heterokaryon incompatibility protein-domain-containing protein [Microdochium trichocladiopsis]KAH7021006.1 heterokaryon incompatibility protein-domain-containing protein [Microdochium trichocladiopsis]
MCPEDTNCRPVKTTAPAPLTSTSTSGHLAYCVWETQKLQRNNLETFCSDVPDDALPQTFKDAIRVARHLGSKYLWIDSFCIIQDSVEDWEAESAVMGEIYRNSQCNIATSNARNGDEGCLYPRNPRLLQPEPFAPPRCDSPEEKWYLHNPDGMDGTYHLYTPAWVLQKVLLAPRTLDCGRSQLYWRCTAMRASEEVPGGFSGPLARSVNHPADVAYGPGKSPGESLRAMEASMRYWEDTFYDRSFGRDRARKERCIRPLRISEFLANAMLGSGSGSAASYWAKLVDVYSAMELTYDTDREVAIAGVTGAFCPFLGSYWAGMWEMLVPAHLNWRTNLTMR